MDQAQIGLASNLDLPLAVLSADGKLNVNAMRTFTTLRKDEWKELDDAVVDVARATLVGVDDLRNAGLVFPLGSIGTTIAEYEKQSDMSAADVDMLGVTAGEEDVLAFTLVGVPVPVIHKGFRLTARQLAASRDRGSGLDTMTATVAGRRVSDKLEDILFNGASEINVNSQELYGYTTEPNRNTLSATGDWGTIANIPKDINRLVSAAESDNYRGPFTLYVSTTQWGEMRAEFTDGSGQTAMDRAIKNQPRITAIKEAASLTDEAVLVQMTRDVIDLAVSVDIQTVEWSQLGGALTRFRVWAIMAPRVKSDANGASGVAHMSSI